MDPTSERRCQTLEFWPLSLAVRGVVSCAQLRSRCWRSRSARRRRAARQFLRHASARAAAPAVDHAVGYWLFGRRGMVAGMVTVGGHAPHALGPVDDGLEAAGLAAADDAQGVGGRVRALEALARGHAAPEPLARRFQVHLLLGVRPPHARAHGRRRLRRARALLRGARPALDRGARAAAARRRPVRARRLEGLPPVDGALASAASRGGATAREALRCAARRTACDALAWRSRRHAAAVDSADGRAARAHRRAASWALAAAPAAAAAAATPDAPLPLPLREFAPLLGGVSLPRQRHVHDRDARRVVAGIDAGRALNRFLARSTTVGPAARRARRARARVAQPLREHRDRAADDRGATGATTPRSPACGHARFARGGELWPRCRPRAASRAAGAAITVAQVGLGVRRCCCTCRSRGLRPIRRLAALLTAFTCATHSRAAPTAAAARVAAHAPLAAPVVARRGRDDSDGPARTVCLVPGAGSRHLIPGSPRGGSAPPG